MSREALDVTPLMRQASLRPGVNFEIGKKKKFLFKTPNQLFET